MIAGALVLGIAILSDIPVASDTGAIGRNFEGAKAMAGPGLYLELAGGALALLTGLARLLRRAGRRSPRSCSCCSCWPGPRPRRTRRLPAPPPHVDGGIGENRGSFLGDPLFDQLGIRNVRLIVPYDVVKGGGRRLRDTDGWLQAARDRGLDVLVSFGFSGRRRLRWHLPTTREYRVHVRAFMRRYPWIHEYSTWNEANHKRVQPTGIYPRRTAVSTERSGVCAWRLTAPPWRPTSCSRARRAPGAGSGPSGAVPAAARTWGAHNYPDANRMASSRTRRFLRTWAATCGSRRPAASCTSAGLSATRPAPPGRSARSSGWPTCPRASSASTSTAGAG